MTDVKKACVSFYQGVCAALGGRQKKNTSKTDDKVDQVFHSVKESSSGASSSSSLGNANVSPFSYRGDKETVYNPIYDGDIENNDSAIEESDSNHVTKSKTPPSSPLSVATPPVEDDEDSQSFISKSGSMVIKDEDSSKSLPAFLLQPAALITHNEWEEILAKEEARLANEDNDDLEPIIMEKSDFTVVLSNRKVIEKTTELSVVPFGLVQGRIAKFSK